MTVAKQYRLRMTGTKTWGLWREYNPGTPFQVNLDMFDMMEFRDVVTQCVITSPFQVEGDTLVCESDDANTCRMRGYHQAELEIGSGWEDCSHSRELTWKVTPDEG